MKHYQATFGKPTKAPSEDELARITARDREIKEAKRKAKEPRK